MLAFSNWSRWLIPLAIVTYIAMLVLGSLLGSTPQVLRGTNDKLLHTLAYGTLATLLFLGMRQPLLRRSAIIVLAIALMGALDEWIQSFFPHRSSDRMDWVADVAAAIAVCSLLSMACWLRDRRRRTA